MEAPFPFRSRCRGGSLGGEKHHLGETQGAQQQVASGCTFCALRDGARRAPRSPWLGGPSGGSQEEPSRRQSFGEATGHRCLGGDSRASFQESCVKTHSAQRWRDLESPGALRGGSSSTAKFHSHLLSASSWQEEAGRAAAPVLGILLLRIPSPSAAGEPLRLVLVLGASRLAVGG